MFSLPHTAVLIKVFCLPPSSVPLLDPTAVPPLLVPPAMLHLLDPPAVPPLLVPPAGSPLLLTVPSIHFLL